MAVQVQFTVSDELYADTHEYAKELGLSVGQFARLVFLSHRHMSAEHIQQARIDDLDRRERERRERDYNRKHGGSRTVRRVDGAGYARGFGDG